MRVAYFENWNCATNKDTRLGIRISPVTRTSRIASTEFPMRRSPLSISPRSSGRLGRSLQGVRVIKSKIAVTTTIRHRVPTAGQARRQPGHHVAASVRMIPSAAPLHHRSAVTTHNRATAIMTVTALVPATVTAPVTVIATVPGAAIATSTAIMTVTAIVPVTVTEIAAMTVTAIAPAIATMTRARPEGRLPVPAEAPAATPQRRQGAVMTQTTTLRAPAVEPLDAPQLAARSRAPLARRSVQRKPPRRPLLRLSLNLRTLQPRRDFSFAAIRTDL